MGRTIANPAKFLLCYREHPENAKLICANPALAQACFVSLEKLLDSFGL